MDLGFVTGTLDFVLEGSSSKKKRARPTPIDEPDRETRPVSRVGDIWTVGAHRILCGDATLAASYVALLGRELAHMALSDMPYNVKVNGHVGGLGKVRHEEFVMGAGEMSPAEFQAFIRVSFEMQARFSRPGAVNLQFGDWRMARDVLNIGAEVYDKLLNLAVWVKPNGGMGSLWRSRHELIFAFLVTGGKPTNNVMLGKNGRNRSNVFEYPSPSGSGREREKLKLHPTCKNVDMLADAIMDVTHRNQVVLDAFLGSGSTALACEQVGRRCRGIELAPAYVDLAVSRLADATGKTPIEQNGLSFDELRVARAEGAAS